MMIIHFFQAVRKEILEWHLRKPSRNFVIFAIIPEKIDHLSPLGTKGLNRPMSRMTMNAGVSMEITYMRH